MPAAMPTPLPTGSVDNSVGNGSSPMETSRRLAILVFSAVPAIVGGGIVYAIFGSLTPMWIYEVLLLVTAGAMVSR
jgi:zinc transporter ZupT